MNKKLRILEVNKAYYPHVGGIESLVKQYAEGFKDIADVKVLVCREDRGKGFSEEINGVKVIRAGSLGTYLSAVSFVCAAVQTNGEKSRRGTYKRTVSAC